MTAPITGKLLGIIRTGISSNWPGPDLETTPTPSSSSKEASSPSDSWSTCSLSPKSPINSPGLSKCHSSRRSKRQKKLAKLAKCMKKLRFRIAKNVVSRRYKKTGLHLLWFRQMKRLKAQRKARKQAYCDKRKLFPELEGIDFTNHDSSDEDQSEELGENVALWLRDDEESCLRIFHIRKYFKHIAIKQIDKNLRIQIHQQFEDLSSQDFLFIAYNIDRSLESHGLPVTALLIFRCISKLIIRKEVANSRSRVVLSMFLAMLLEVFGLKMLCHILVHFHDKFDRLIDRAKRFPTSTSHKLDNCISFFCYLFISKVISFKFISILINKLTNHAEEKFVQMLHLMCKLLGHVLIQPDRYELRRLLLPYQPQPPPDEEIKWERVEADYRCSNENCCNSITKSKAEGTSSSQPSDS